MGDLTTKIRLFFEDPAIYHPPSRYYSVLYLLRRDIKTCLGINPNTGAATGSRALWPGAMAILAGIDLLGKFFAGSDDTGKGKVGKRFRGFLTQYFKPISKEDAATIYQLRNSLLHSFGLYSRTKDREYKFVLSAENQPLVQCLANDNYLIDILTLHSKFESSIEAYRAKLVSDDTLQGKFAAMFPNYGSVVIGDRGRWLTYR